MRHFDSFSAEALAEVFMHEPVEFTKDSPKELLSSSLGATIYTPAVRDDLLNDLRKMRSKDATSVVVCLEDSIPDERVEEAEQKLHKLLLQLNELPNMEDLPLVFVRPRTPEHLWQIAQQNEGLMHSLTGFVFPKFDDLNSVASNFVLALQTINTVNKTNLYYMPVIESPSIIYRETREAALNGISHVIARSRDELLAVRIGATDMSSPYGLRRSRDFTVYDVHVVSSAIADIVNVLGRSEDENIITGAVWEHFNPAERTFKPMLREALFNKDRDLRNKLLTEGYDTFIREIQLDKINGITGKTVIYPSHIALVHSLLVVSHEEYSDAEVVLKDDNSGGGAYASEYRNKMNEVKPHTAWARKIMNRAKMFGVSNKDVDFVDFLERFETL